MGCLELESTKAVSGIGRRLPCGASATAAVRLLGADAAMWYRVYPPQSASVKRRCNSAGTASAGTGRLK
jgi:hypothetical protein